MKANYYENRVASTSIIRESFAWMFGGLLVTFASAVGALSSETFMKGIITNPILFFGLIIGEFGMVVALSAGINRFSKPVATSLFLAYAVLNGLTLSTIFLAYTGASIGVAFLSSALCFGIMAVYGYATRSDLTGVGNFAIMALVGLIVASLVNFFFQSPALSYFLSYAAIIIFTLLTAYDVQKLKEMSSQIGSTGNLGIYGALRLYLDFINIFLSLLRIVGQRRS